MVLLDFIPSAVGGFTAGLAVGLVGFPEKRIETLDKIELIPENKRKPGINNSQIGKARDMVNRLTYTLPFAIGSVGPPLDYLVSQNQAFPENLAVSISSAYVGNFIGRGIRKFRRREKLEEEKNIIRATVDPGNMHKYLLPMEAQKRLENSFSEIEQKLLEGVEMKDLIGDTSLGNCPCAEIYRSIVQSGSPYIPALLNWSMEKQREIFERTDMQNHAKNFYEMDYQEKMGIASVADCAFIGALEEPKVKVFTKQGGDFYIQTVDFPDLRIVRNDKSQSSEIQARPSINLTDREPWTDDYRALSQRIIYETSGENKGYSTMLMRIPEDMPSKMREGLIVTSFLKQYEEFHRKDMKE